MCKNVHHTNSEYTNKGHLGALFAALEGEDEYIETQNLLSKINLYIR